MSGFSTLPSQLILGAYEKKKQQKLNDELSTHKQVKIIFKVNKLAPLLREQKGANPTLNILGGKIKKEFIKWPDDGSEIVTFCTFSSAEELNSAASVSVFSWHWLKPNFDKNGEVVLYGPGVSGGSIQKLWNQSQLPSQLTIEINGDQTEASIHSKIAALASLCIMSHCTRNVFRCCWTVL